MRQHRDRFVGRSVFAVASLIAGTAAAADTLIVIPGESTISVTISASVAGIPFTDTETSAVSGFFDVTSDGLTSIAFSDGALLVNNTLNFVFSAGFLGSANIRASSLVADLAAPIPAVPITGGTFSVTGAQFATAGIFDYTSSGLLGGAVGSGQVLLDGSTIVSGDLESGTATLNGSTLRIGAVIDVTNTTDLNGIPVTVRLAGTVVAEGTISPPTCPADFNGDTVPGDIFDLFDFLAALDEGLDFNGDTSPADIFDLFDFLAVLDAGCP